MIKIVFAFLLLVFGQEDYYDNLDELYPEVVDSTPTTTAVGAHVIVIIVLVVVMVVIVVGLFTVLFWFDYKKKQADKKQQLDEKQCKSLFEHFRAHPQFDELQDLLKEKPHMVNSVGRQFSSSNPKLGKAILRYPDLFLAVVGRDNTATNSNSFSPSPASVTDPIPNSIPEENPDVEPPSGFKLESDTTNIHEHIEPKSAEAAEKKTPPKSSSRLAAAAAAREAHDSASAASTASSAGTAAASTAAAKAKAATPAKTGSRPVPVVNVDVDDGAEAVDVSITAAGAAVATMAFDYNVITGDTSTSSPLGVFVTSSSTERLSPSTPTSSAKKQLIEKLTAGDDNPTPVMMEVKADFEEEINDVEKVIGRKRRTKRGVY